jgi:DNA-binding MurR/RpiR family transcriptional regulator
LQSLVKSATYLPAAARRVLEILLAAADQEDSYKKNGKLNGNAIAQKANISQSTISRQLSVIQDAAVEMLGEMEAAEEMDMW